jgi:spermidine synthase
MNRSRLVPILFFLSGFTGLIYELIWIRLFSIRFGQTYQALGTVLGVYLGGLAVGACAAGLLLTRYSRRGLMLYGAAEALTAIYALATPWLIEGTQTVLRLLYETGYTSTTAVSIARVMLCSAILLPATALMGASLPLLAAYCEKTGRNSIESLYLVNLAGASAGAVLSGFVFLPAIGYLRSLAFACAINGAVGIAALASGKQLHAAQTGTRASESTSLPQLRASTWITAIFLTGNVCMLHEVVWGRIYGLLLGPTASTISLVLAIFLAGLAFGAILARRMTGDPRRCLCLAQFGCFGMLMWTYASAGALPNIIGDRVRLHYGSPPQIEAVKAAALGATLLPLTVVLGVSFPLLMRIAPANGVDLHTRIGRMYGLNTAGCIAGALGTAWFLVPVLGTQATLLLGAVATVGLGVLLSKTLQPTLRILAIAGSTGALLLAIFLLPRWRMSSMTAGTYKYAPYYGTTATADLEPVFLREGSAGTVTVRKEGSSLVLAVEGKVDASDAGGDLLTEKLLAHLPLMLTRDAKRVCLIGLASGVTAGAMLTHPVDALDVVEISPDIVTASHFFDKVNGHPLEDTRTTLLVNDGRNHLALTSTKYDLIVSEPSNPWIAGMNILFTEDFFRIVKRRLSLGGVFAQWFHIYNMPKGDLQRLLRAFVDVFPSAMLWQLNDGDVLLTGFAESAPMRIGNAPPKAAADLDTVGVAAPRLLLNMYVMRDNDIRRFAGSAPANTDDNSLLEFHGQADLHAQTDLANAKDLADLPKQPPPEEVRDIREHLTYAQLFTNAQMFERAESYRSAFRDYQLAFAKDPTSWLALAGMDRTAGLPENRAAVLASLGLSPAEDNLAVRTERALEKGRNGDVFRAEFLLAENAEAHPTDSAARLNYGLFCLERKRYSEAIQHFQRAINLSPGYVSAYEAMAETYLELRDASNAVTWSKRILQLDPQHQIARQTVAALERASD